MKLSTDTQLKLMLALYFVGVFTLFLWVFAGLWAVWLYWRTRHPVARGGVRLLWQGLLLWALAFLILPFTLTQLTILLPAALIMFWAGLTLWRSVMLFVAVDVTPMDS